MIPNDPVILLGFINMKLRDCYSSLQALCDGLEADMEEITAKLAGIGYHYMPESNQFK